MFKKGTIILIPFPFTDLSSIKVRPALIISSSQIKGEDLILTFISSNHSSQSKTDVLIKKSSQNGLKLDSRIKVNKIATLNKKIVLGELGQAGDDILNKVNKKLQLIFDIGSLK